MKCFGSGLQTQTLPTFLPAIGLRLTPLSLQVDEFTFCVLFQTNMNGKVFMPKCSTGRTWKSDMACASLLIGAGAKTYPLTYSESLLLKLIPLVPFPNEDKCQMFVGISFFFFLSIVKGSLVSVLRWPGNLSRRYPRLSPYVSCDWLQPPPILQRMCGYRWMDGLHHTPGPNRSESNTNRCSADLQINIYVDK